MTSMAGAAAGGAADMRVRAAAIFQTLIDCFGTPTFRPGSDPTEELIGTILSANTTDVNSGRAFARLQQLGDWDAIRTAPLPAIIDAIRPAGMYNQKGPHIVATLEQLRSKWGGYDLSDLATMAVDEALAFLTSMPGVGQKTASIVLLFCFNRGVFPVDTHIHRMMYRWNLSNGKSVEQTERDAKALFPEESWKRKFTKPGEHPYICGPHPEMVGRVIVE